MTIGPLPDGRWIETADDAERAGMPESVVRNLRGKELEEAGDVARATELYEQNVAERFHGTHPYQRLAVIYRRLKDPASEQRVLRAALDARTNDGGNQQEWRRQLTKSIDKHGNMDPQ